MSKINRNSHTRNSYVPLEKRESLGIQKSITSLAGKSRKVLTIPLARESKKIDRELEKANSKLDAFASEMETLISKIDGIADSVKNGICLPSEGFKHIEQEIVSYMNKFTMAQLNYQYAFQQKNKLLQKGLKLSFHPNKAKKVKILNEEGIKNEVDRIITKRFNLIMSRAKPSILKIDAIESDYQKKRQDYNNI